MQSLIPQPPVSPIQAPRRFQKYTVGTAPLSNPPHLSGCQERPLYVPIGLWKVTRSSALKAEDPIYEATVQGARPSNEGVEPTELQAMYTWGSVYLQFTGFTSELEGITSQTTTNIIYSLRG